jgi:hypothetical protein
LEFFLYQLCKTTAPGLIDDCHWSCAEAAELTTDTRRTPIQFAIGTEDGRSRETYANLVFSLQCKDCAEAAELTRLSEKVTEFFCFHHKPIFKDCGISEQLAHGVRISHTCWWLPRLYRLDEQHNDGFAEFLAPQN